MVAFFDVCHDGAMTRPVWSSLEGGLLVVKLLDASFCVWTCVVVVVVAVVLVAVVVGCVVGVGVVAAA